jgi:hypothetical protein
MFKLLDVYLSLEVGLFRVFSSSFSNELNFYSSEKFSFRFIVMPLSLKFKVFLSYLRTFLHVWVCLGRILFYYFLSL